MISPKEIEYVLDSMTLIYDSREHQTEALIKRLEGTGFKYRRECLKFGDYTIEYEIDGQPYNLQNEIVIERKMGLDEICNNFTKKRKAFENEFERATKAGAKVHLLIENADYEKILSGNYRSQMNSNSLFSSIVAFSDRYNLTTHFCRPETTPILMNKLFRHHVKNKLEKELLS